MRRLNKDETTFNTCKPGMYFKIHGKTHSENGSSRNTKGRCNTCTSLINVATMATPAVTLKNTFQRAIFIHCKIELNVLQFN